MIFTIILLVSLGLNIFVFIVDPIVNRREREQSYRTAPWD